MENFDAIKILEEELEDKNLFDRNLSKERYMKSVFNFVEVYLKPNLRRKLTNENLIAPKEMAEEIRQDVLNDKSISEKDKQVMLKDETINAYYFDKTLNELIVGADNLINALGLIDDYDDEENIIYSEDDKILHWLNPEEIGFLNKDKKIKNKVAEKFSQFLITTFKESMELNEKD